eukprot:7026802-Prymnesium_polylepis.1
MAGATGGAVGRRAALSGAGVLVRSRSFDVAPAGERAVVQQQVCSDVVGRRCPTVVCTSAMAYGRVEREEAEDLLVSLCCVCAPASMSAVCGGPGARV